MKNHYATLGVTSQAEDVVIKAAYRALAQRYHPDRSDNSTQDTNFRMAEINEAYSILSDPIKKKIYDEEYRQFLDESESLDAGDAAANEGTKQINNDWNVALEYYPDLSTIERSLAKVSNSLAFTYRLYIITEKTYQQRKEIAELMRYSFLKKFFGEQKSIIEFANWLIDLGRKDVAKALNEAVRVLGDELDQILVINKINSRFGLSQNYENRNQSKTNTPFRPSNLIRAGAPNSRAERMTKRAITPNATYYDLRDAIEELNGHIKTNGEGCEINIFGESFTADERSKALDWFRDYIFPRLCFS